MRGLIFAILLAAAPALALAEDVDDATLKAVAAVAAKGYANPGAAQIRNVHKSNAAHGLGYCGEVSVEDAAGGFTVFHAFLGDASTAPSVLRLADFPETDVSPNAVLMRQLMVDFGCTE